MRNSVWSRSWIGILIRACLVIGLAWLTGTGSAQLSTASLSGTARDSSGAVVTNATVVLRSVDTSIERTSVTNSAGEYVFLNITPGRYTLEAKATGFAQQQIPEFLLT